jgi:beta-lactamase regulating signal transducer with metallopeptidase domain
VSTLVGLADGARAAVELIAVALVHGTVLAAVAWLLSATVLRRARPAVLAAVWTVVLVKFALPVGPAMPWSVSDLIALAIGGGDDALAPWVVPGHAAAAPVAAPTGPDLLGLAALAALALWLAAVAIIASRRIDAQRAALDRARALPAAPPAIAELAAAVAARLGVARVPALHVDPTGSSPWVAGVRRPIVVIPTALVASPGELASALAHELGHLRRRDAWLRLAQVAIGALFFFWPVVRRVNHRIDVAREMACDAYALAHGPLPARDYARLLVRLVRSGAPDGAFALATTPRLLRGRVDALLIARPGAAPGIGKLGALGLAGWTALALGGSARAGASAPHGEVCLFTPALASSFLAAHPEADADKDGVLTRAEACDFQLELRRRIVDEIEVAYDPAFDTDGDGALSLAEAAARRDRLATQLPGAVLAATSPLAAESMCCNCGDGEGTSTPPTGLTVRANEPADTCVRGVDP